MKKSALITGALKRIEKDFAIALGKNGHHIFLYCFNSKESAQQIKRNWN